MEQPFNPFRQGTAEKQMVSQVHKLRSQGSFGEAEELFVGWTEDSPHVSNLILMKKAASKSPISLTC